MSAPGSWVACQELRLIIQDSVSYKGAHEVGAECSMAQETNIGTANGDMNKPLTGCLWHRDLRCSCLAMLHLTTCDSRMSNTKDVLIHCGDFTNEGTLEVRLEPHLLRFRRDLLCHSRLYPKQTNAKDSSRLPDSFGFIVFTLTAWKHAASSYCASVKAIYGKRNKKRENTGNNKKQKRKIIQ